MAEIQIKKKERPIWPWILGLLIVIAIVAWLIFGNKKQNNQTSQLRAESELTLKSKHLRYVPEVMVTRLETYLA
jgi:hypothetical protein